MQLRQKIDEAMTTVGVLMHLEIVPNQKRETLMSYIIDGGMT